jgi:hypothetical protein
MWHVWGEEKCIQNFGGESRRKMLLEKPWHNWEDNIKMYHKKQGMSSTGLILPKTAKMACFFVDDK